MSRLITRLALVAGLLLAALLPAAAANAAAYRFWGYYQLQGDTWSFATKGPDQTKPADGSVEGWRYAVADTATPRLPRATVTFDDLCADTKAETGKKRVGVVIDYGRAADSEDGATPPKPVGDCVVVDTAATGSEVLAAAADARVEKGLVCGIGGYPAAGCGGEVKTVSAAAKAADDTVKLDLGTKASASSTDDGTSTATWVGIGVVAALLVGLGGLVVARRRSA